MPHDRPEKAAEEALPRATLLCTRTQIAMLHDVSGNLYARITDVDLWSGDKLGDLILILAAK